MQDKVAKIKEIFAKIDPSVELEIHDHGDSINVVGPFPSFMLLIEETGPIRSLVHVNADAPNMVVIFGEFSKELDLEMDGAYAINGDTGEILFNVDAYKKKEDNILMFAGEIRARRGDKVGSERSLIVPEEKKIILA